MGLCLYVTILFFENILQIFHKILECEDPAVEKAQILLNRILKRDFYKEVIEINVKKESRLRNMTESNILTEILTFVGQNTPPPVNIEEQLQDPLREEEVVVLSRKIDMGMGQKNPVAKVFFLLFNFFILDGFANPINETC